jgi:hypothetical protein
MIVFVLPELIETHFCKSGSVNRVIAGTAQSTVMNCDTEVIAKGSFYEPISNHRISGRGRSETTAVRCQCELSTLHGHS